MRWLLLAVLFASAAAGQQLAIVNTTPPPTDARFAIIQGTVGFYSARFKLDRYTGQVWASNGGAWKPMKVAELPVIATPRTPRFQMLWLFGAQNTSTQILLDCQTGKTWQLEPDGWKLDQETASEKTDPKN
jgi:hypothetical protein